MCNFSVSIIIPLYKGMRYISYWQDVIQRNYTVVWNTGIDLHCELLFVNDYPEEHIDKTALDKDVPITDNLTVRIINLERNRGIHGARVFGLDNACGDYLIFMDQDDLITEDYLQTQIESIGDSDAVVCAAYYEKCFGRRKDIISLEEDELTLSHFVEKGNPIASPGQVMLKKFSVPEVWRDNIMQTNGIDDYFLWITMLSDGCKFILNGRIAYTHIATDCNTSRSIDYFLSSREMMNIIIKKSILPSCKMAQLMKRNEYRWKSARINIIANILEAWLLKEGQGRHTSCFFESRGWNRIAIYGMSRLGDMLCMMLHDSPVTVLFGIDRKAESFLYEGIPVFLPEQAEAGFKIQDVDAVIVTAVMDYDVILQQLRKNGFRNILHISEFVNEL